MQTQGFLIVLKLFGGRGEGGRGGGGFLTFLQKVFCAIIILLFPCIDVAQLIYIRSC